MDSGARVFSARPDTVDLRDYEYMPSLRLLPPTYVSPSLLATQRADCQRAEWFKIRDQKDSATCVGQALATLIDIQRLQNRLEAGLMDKPGETSHPRFVSAEMIHCMAQALEDDDVGGTSAQRGLLSLRSGLKAFFNCGVCLETSWKPDTRRGFASLSREAAEEARSTTLGAYFRVQNSFNDFHNALVDTGAVLASAFVHEGWNSPVAGRIVPTDIGLGQQSHAFVIVGYTSEGFLVLNSFGAEWSTYDFEGTLLQGVALWSYEDWASSIRDAWVLRLGVSTPGAFRYSIGRHGKPTTGFANATNKDLGTKPTVSTPRLAKVVGRFLNFRDGRYRESGVFPSSGDSLKQTLDILKQRDSNSSSSPYYGDVVLHIAGIPEPLTSTMDALDRTILPDKADGIYRIKVVWCGELLESVMQAMAPLMGTALARAGEPGQDCDRLIEKLLSPIGRAVWRDIKQQAKRLVTGTDKDTPGELAKAIFQIASCCHASGRRLHIIADAIGALPIVALMKFVAGPARPKDRSTLLWSLRSIQLVAPTVAELDFEKVYLKFAEEWRHVRRGGSLTLLRPSDAFARLITFRPYSKTWTHLVQTAFEQQPSCFIGDNNYVPPPALKINTVNLEPDFDYHELPSYHLLFDQPATDAKLRETILGFQSIKLPLPIVDMASLPLGPVLKTQRRWSLHIGCAVLKPAYYGQAEPLAGCANDVHAFSAMALQSSYDNVEILIDAAATRAAVILAIERASVHLDSGDVFLISYSGHGSTATDENGDEGGSKLDQTWCLYDGELVDDELASLWGNFKNGVRICLISDSCHSGSIVAAPRKIPKNMKLKGIGKSRNLPFRNELQVLQSSAQRAILPMDSSPLRKVEAGVLQISACKDEELAYEIDAPVPYGALTASILQALHNGKNVGMGGLLEMARKQLLPLQTPQLLTFGNVTADWVDAALFSPDAHVPISAGNKTLKPRDFVVPKERPGLSFLPPLSQLEQARLDGILATAHSEPKKSIYANVKQQSATLSMVGQAVCAVFILTPEKVALEHFGSGTLIAANSILTNNHVLKHCFAANWTLNNGCTVEFRFLNGAVARPISVTAPAPPSTKISDDLDWDLLDVAVVNVGWTNAIAPPNPLAASTQVLARDTQIAAIGCPKYENQAGWFRVFGPDTTSIMRLMPGLVVDHAKAGPQGHKLHIGYDCSTQGGASGSALIDLASCTLVGIHVGSADGLNYGHSFAQLNWPL